MQLSDQEILNLIQEIETKENKDRKAKEYVSFQIYEGNLRYYVQDRLKGLFPKTWDGYSVMDYSILKKITDKKSKAYKETPIRKLDNQTETDAYQLVLKRGRFNRTMRRLDKFYNQHKYALIGVFRDKTTNAENKSEEQWKFMALAPYEFDVVLNDDGQPKVVVLSYPDNMVVSGQPTDNINSKIAGAIQDGGLGKKVFTFWTDTNHYYIQATRSQGGDKWEISHLDIENNPNKENPYKCMNFVYVPFDSGLDYPVASPLSYQTVELNANLSVYETSGNFQIGSLVVEHPAEQAVDTVKIGLFNAIKLPQSDNADVKPTKAYFISPTPNLEGHKDAIMTHASLILDEQGIRGNKNIVEGEEFSSGLDRIIANADVNDIIEENQEDYLLVEQGVYGIVKTMIKNMDNSETLKSEDLNIVYRKPKVMITDSERLDNIAKKKALNIFHDYELLQDYDPNLSDEEAKQKIKDIRAGRKEVADEMTLEMDNEMDDEEDKDAKLV